MKNLVCFFLGIILVSCYKENVPVINPLIGEWSIFQVDSGSSPFNPKKYFTLIKQLEYSGSIEFKNDSTGYLLGSIANISDNMSKFLWEYDTTYLPNIYIPFAFLSGESLAVMDTLYSDTLKIYFPDFIFLPHLVGIKYCNGPLTLRT
jgi:hypothetical protein